MNKLKIVGMTLCAGFLYFSAAAQTISLGPIGSFGGSWVSVSDSSGADKLFHPAWSVGLTLIYSPSEHWGFGLDARYSREGSTFKHQISGTEVETTLNLAYVRIPLKAIYFFKEYGDPVRPKLFAGPSFGLLASAEAEDFDQTSFYNALDIGLIIGGGVNIRLAEAIWLNTDLAYYQGLMDISNDDIGLTENNLNSNVSLSVGLAFGIASNKE
ncbi:MAG: PorT family protein [Chitinophagales bacterium]|nr:PorT family protein [Chitinophagales bacterium]